jgi:hypothetical protein
MGLTAFNDYVAPEVRWIRRGRVKLVGVDELRRWVERSGSLTIEEGDL